MDISPYEATEAQMSGSGTVSAGGELALKITKLVEERGWTQEDFARISTLNRHTIRQILNGGPKRRLRNDTVSKCADALGLTVNDLRTLPLERLLPRMHGKPPADEEAVNHLYDRASLPELVSWLERNNDRARELRQEEIAELLEQQTPGGQLQLLGVEQFIVFLERRRALMHKVHYLANTEFVTCLETFVGLCFEKSQQMAKR